MFLYGNCTIQGMVEPLGIYILPYRDKVYEWSRIDYRITWTCENSDVKRWDVRRSLKIAFVTPLLSLGTIVFFINPSFQ